MSKKFQLQIPEPCHESWDKMTPVDKRRFCDFCQKSVHDFTGMSDAQLIQSSLAMIEAKTTVFVFQIPHVTPGSYVLALTNKKTGKKHSEKIIIQ